MLESLSRRKLSTQGAFPMTIPNETRSSEHLLNYSRYHVAALKADPDAEQLVAGIEAAVHLLRSAHLARQNAEQAAMPITAWPFRKASARWWPIAESRKWRK
jgi:hypothetical protein